MNKIGSMCRRDFIRAACLGAAAAVGGPAVSERASTAARAKTNPERPNVLFLMCDQLTASVLSCYGGPVPTPHIDRIAREGVRFDQATCPTPFCSPTRAAIVMGMYPHAHGIVVNVGSGQRGIRTGDVTTERILSDSGYATHHYGKWHLTGDNLPYYRDMFRPGFEYADEMAATFKKVRATDPAGWMNWYKWPLPVEIAPPFQKAVDALGDRWRKQRYAEFITKMGRLKLPLEQNYDVRIGQLTAERVRKLGREKKPFMVTCSFNGPHDPNVVPSPYYEMFPPDEIELPANRHVREKRFEKNWSREIVAGLGEPGLREFLRIYYGMVKLIDDQVGRILGALESAGVMDETVIVFTADHGDMAGGHGMVWKSTDAFYDEIARVPLLIRYPRRFGPQRSNLAADLVDLMPTLLELCGRPVPGQAQGQSLVRFLAGERDASEARPFSYSERVPRQPRGRREVPPGTRGSFMIRGRGWKYVRYPQGDDYLYHLAEDPGETRNLATDAKQAARRKEMKSELDDWLRRTGWPT